MLRFLLAFEVVTLGAVDVTILAKQGISSLSSGAISPHMVLGGATGVALVYVFTCFLGFEGTAIYSEEARQPLCGISRATYWLTVIVWLTAHYVSSAWSDLLSVLVTSVFAGVLASQNATARYFFALARDGALPKPPSHVDARHGTPATVIALYGLIVTGGVAVFGLTGLDPLLTLSTSMAGIGTIGLVTLLSVASVAIAAYFFRSGDRRLSVTVVPIVAAVLLGICMVAGGTKYSALTGIHSTVINSLLWLYIPVAVTGVVVALRLKSRDPRRYADLGSSRVD